MNELEETVKTMLRMHDGINTFMRAQLDANKHLAQEIEDLRGEIAILKNDKNVMNIMSNLIPTRGIHDA
jgi:hypothetical protein